MKRKAIAILVAGAVGVLLAPLPAGARPEATTDRVVMKEFSFKLSAMRVKRGIVVFALKNSGNIVHDFKINGKKSALIKPGKTGTLRVTFKRAGRFPYICTIPGHAQAGMKGVLRVT